MALLRIVFLLGAASALILGQVVKDGALDSSIVQIVLKVTDKESASQGTGFVVGEGGLIATAFHVYAAAVKTASDARGGRIEARRASRGSGKWVSGSVDLVGADPQADIIVLRIQNVGAEWEMVGGLKPLKLSVRTEITPPIRTRVVGYFGQDMFPIYLGCELGGTGSVSLGTRGNVEEFLLSGLLLPGHSGSPVIDEADGTVVGVVSSIVPVNLPFNPSQLVHSGLAKAAKVEHLNRILNSIGSK